ncbi:MAG: RidA family protein [Spirochaetales bacterium]|nr:RidA family protein [Spirochaetales bacterium]
MKDEKLIIETKNAPAAIGPYSQAVRAGDIVFISGQLGIDPETGKLVPGDVVKEAEQAMKNLDSIIKAAGGSMDDIVKTTILLDNLDNFTVVNKIYSSFFPEGFPARACYEVSRLPAGGKVEIEAVAYLKNKQV